MLKMKIEQDQQGVGVTLKPQKGSIAGVVQTYRDARAKFQKLRIVTLRDVFERMRLFSTMKRAHRQLKWAARHRKIQQQHSILQIAEDAASRGDSKELFRCVRWLAPKSFKQRIRLRDSHGSLLSPAEECHALAEHAKQLFHGDTQQYPALMPLPAELFTSQAWLWALSKIRSHKAVPRNEPAVQSWKDSANAAAYELESISRQALCGPHPVLLIEWCTVQLAWLPKPNKSPTTPANLRSIGLLSTDSKAFLLLLRREVMPYIRAGLIDIPQYAYRPQAGTLDALLRTSSHCAEVRALLEQHQRDYTSKILDEPQVSLAGGFMCSLDLAKAFDSVPHAELYNSMLEVGVPENLAIMLVTLHCRTVCVIDHGKQRKHVRMRRGLRQGCPIAPILYACWTVRLCRVLDARLGHGWSSRHLSIFADDTHGCWVIRKPQDLLQGIQQLKTLIETLQAMGLIINYTKSHVVIQLRGHQVAKLSKSIFKQQHGTKCLRIKAARDFYIPCVDQIEYLGAVLSYANFEGQTVLHRVNKAEGTFRQLRVPLRSRSALCTGHRLRIYKAIVLSSLLYGLVGVGLSAEVIKKVSSTVAGHMRKILRVYEHGVKNEDVLLRADIDPLDLLATGAQRLQRSVQQDDSRSNGLKLREQLRISFIVDQVNALRAQPKGLSILAVRKAEICVVECPECGLSFGTREGLAQHLRLRHPALANLARIPFDRAVHSLHGIPVCRFCHVRLHDWSSLSKHLSGGNCGWVKDQVARGRSPTELLAIIAEREALDPPQPPHELLEMQSIQQVRELLHQPLDVLQHKGSMLRCLAKQCILCAQRVQHSSKIKTHWQQQHAQAWAISKQDAYSGAQSLVALFRQPCQFCGSTAKDSKDHAVKCAALFQFLAARAHRTKTGSQDSETGSGRQLTQPTDASLKQQILSKHFAGVQVAKPFTSLARPPSEQAVTNPGTQSYPGDDGSGLFSRTWIAGLRLVNPGNHCYANAAVCALLSVFTQYLDIPQGLRALHRVCWHASSRSQALTLKRQFAMRSCVPRWPFNGAQQDAVEFTGQLLEGVGWTSGRWEARSLQDGHIQCFETGYAPITLPVPAHAFALQDAIQAWHAKSHLYALTEASVLIFLQLGRHTGGAKNHTEADFQACVRMPVFLEGLDVQWVPYEVQSAILHYGDTPLSGHYRSQLRLSDSDHWYLTDDNVTAQLQQIQSLHRCNQPLCSLDQESPRAIEPIHC